MGEIFDPILASVLQTWQRTLSYLLYRFTILPRGHMRSIESSRAFSSPHCTSFTKAVLRKIDPKSLHGRSQWFCISRDQTIL